MKVMEDEIIKRNSYYQSLINEQELSLKEEANGNPKLADIY